MRKIARFGWMVVLGVTWSRAQPLVGTQPLTGTNDLSDAYLSGLDRFTLRETERVAAERSEQWRQRMAEDGATVAAWLATNRAELARMLGVRDARVPFDAPETLSTLTHDAVVGRTATHTLMRIRWPVIGDFAAEGLLLEPAQQPIATNIVHLPHAGITPEQVLGLTNGAAAASRLGFGFPSPNCRMVVPAVISRAKSKYVSELPNPYYGKQAAAMPGGKVMTAREFVYRPAYVMGRHIIGYEVQEVLALVDWFRAQAPTASVRVEGWGDGGMLALYAGALDTRIDHAVVSGYFGAREALWREPVDRNVFGLIRRFGDAEVAALIAPRRLTVLMTPGPVETITREQGEGGAPGALIAPAADAVGREIARARQLVSADGEGWLVQMTEQEAAKVSVVPLAGGRWEGTAVGAAACAAREARLVKGMNAFSQHLLAVSPAVRHAFLAELNLSSPDAFDRSAEAYRRYYLEQVMGRIHSARTAPNPRTRVVDQTSGYVCYEVVLDVLPDFILYGYLSVPNGIQSGERRPLIVVQHGRGGTPRTPMALKNGGIKTYHEIAPRLAERGYLVFAPQNPYVFEDRYRQLVRKANPLQWTLYSYIHLQYEQMFDWFGTLPFVDGARIAFIGQSYGGKTAVRVPPVMKRFCLAVSTGDFNEGVVKMASTRYPFSFALWDEYEMFEFDLGNTFNYSDLACLMIPRPFMAQRGHADGVAWDEFVGYEYARVRCLYTKLGLADRTAIHWFDGGHEIALDAACEFFDRFLKP
ncbi:MAG TPA: hypothetical protein P5026_05940 [Kiritimatiellia bacterium]|nr:hypothetical protein [Kiritimatiellia bacterium]HRU70632.1 hypothetical protein [Kiritimatiellia bacterium]